MSKHTIIKSELDSNIPLYGALTDQQVADELNLLQFSAEGGISGMMSYLLENKNRSNTGADTLATPILGRLHHVADSVVGDDPFGSTVLVTLKGKHAAQSFVDLLTNPHLKTIDFTSVNLEFAALKDMEIMKQGDIDALIDLSTNMASRAMQIGAGRVRVGDVEIARAL